MHVLQPLTLSFKLLVCPMKPMFQERRVTDMPAAACAVMLAVGSIVLSNPAQAAGCDASGNITGANGAITLGFGVCPAAPGVVPSATVVSGATVTSGGTGVAAPASPGWAVTNQGAITATGNAVTGDVLFTLTNSGSMTAGAQAARCWAAARPSSTRLAARSLAASPAFRSAPTEAPPVADLPLSTMPERSPAAAASMTPSSWAWAAL